MSKIAAYQPIPTLDEELAFVPGSDALTYNAYFQSTRAASLREPERRLMLAVLTDAIGCFQRNLLARPGTDGELVDEAERWILEDDPDWPFSFANICQHLGIDPHCLRAGLLRWKNKLISRQRNAVIWQRGPLRLLAH